MADQYFSNPATAGGKPGAEGKGGRGRERKGWREREKKKKKKQCRVPCTKIMGDLPDPLDDSSAPKQVSQ